MRGEERATGKYWSTGRNKKKKREDTGLQVHILTLMLRKAGTYITSYPQFSYSKVVPYILL